MMTAETIEQAIGQDALSIALFHQTPAQRARTFTPLQRALGRLEFEERIALARLRRLPRDQQRALSLRFGLDGGGERLQREVGRLMRCSQETASSLERAAIARIRDGDPARGELPLDRVWERVRGVIEPAQVERIPLP